MNFEEFKDHYQMIPVEEYLNQVSENPVVSVSVLTYQHAPYIRECLDSILMQETDFPVEILVGEDDSSDGTREICIKYAEKHPDRIRLFLHHRDNNIKIMGRPTGRFNVLYNFYSAQGKYIALCEGDDYWTDPLKLQKQVDFLRKNQEFSGCTHACRIQYVENNRSKIVKHNGHSEIDLGYYLKKNIFLTTSSLIFKKAIVKDYPSWTLEMFAGDFVLKYIMFTYGKIKYIDSVMTTYRKGVRNSWSKQKLTQKKIDIEFADNMKALIHINQMTSYKYSKEVQFKMKKNLKRYIARSISIMESNQIIIHLIKNIFLLSLADYKIIIKALIQNNTFKMKSYIKNPIIQNK